MNNKLSLMFVAAVVSLTAGFACAGGYSNPERFESSVAGFEKSDAEAMPPAGAVLCIGSSSMRMWHPTIKEDLAPLTVIPRGFGGSTMNDLLAFTDRIVMPYKPRAILVYEEDNDAQGGISVEAEKKYEQGE